jgi:pilus assembly protein Flp/PilA
MNRALAHLLGILGALEGRLGTKDRGATAVEYGLLVGLIAVVIIAGVTLLGNNLLALFNGVAAQI